jgi:hypothetical protein
VTRTRCWTKPALLCLLLFQALTSGTGVFAGGPAEPPAEKAALPGTPKSPPSPLEAGPQRQVVQMELKGQDDPEPKLGYGNCQ